MWPPPGNRHSNRKWPARSCAINLAPSAKDRNPPITMWARATFEQGCLAILHTMEGNSKVITLPGDQLFQAATLPDVQAHFRAPILHAYGPNKDTAPSLLSQLAEQGWETLMPAVFGAQSKNAPWQSGTWTPDGGLAIKSTASSATINANMQAALNLRWPVSTSSHRHPSVASPLFNWSPPSVWNRSVLCH